jgi:hypothetical protein
MVSDYKVADKFGVLPVASAPSIPAQPLGNRESTA